MKPWVKYSFAAMLFVGGVGGSIYYDQFLAPYINSEYVYVASKPIMDANTSITRALRVRVRMPKNLVSPGAITNEAELATLFTSEQMSENEQFTAVNTEPDPFTITPGTEDVPMPQTWIASMSPTLRQGDYVDLTPIVMQQSGTTPLPLVTNTTDLDHILVLSVHTGQNTEVTDASANGPQTVGARQNGSGTPSALDLKMTVSQALALETYVQDKYQLLIAGVSPHDTDNTNSAVGSDDPSKTPSGIQQTGNTNSVAQNGGGQK